MTIAMTTAIVMTNTAVAVAAAVAVAVAVAKMLRHGAGVCLSE